MRISTDFPARPVSTPWTLRAYDALPGNPLTIGIAFTVVLLVAFFIGRIPVGDTGSTPDDLRIAITQILMAAYVATAYAYLLMTARITTEELAGVIDPLPDRDAFVEAAGR